MAYRHDTYRRSYDFARPRSRRERIARIDSLATLLDTALIVPILNLRFGLDAVLGLMPGIGDLLTTAMSLYIVHEARQLGAPAFLVARMLGNVAMTGLSERCRWWATSSM